jgi:hypothetical protein
MMMMMMMMIVESTCMARRCGRAIEVEAMDVLNGME